MADEAATTGPRRVFATAGHLPADGSAVRVEPRVSKARTTRPHGIGSLHPASVTAERCSQPFPALSFMSVFGVPRAQTLATFGTGQIFASGREQLGREQLS